MSQTPILNSKNPDVQGDSGYFYYGVLAFIKGLHTKKKSSQIQIPNIKHWPKTYNVSHDAEFVQRRLSIEENNVPVYHVPFHHVAKPQLLGNLLAVSIL